MRVLGVNGIHNWSWSKDSFTDRILAALSYRHEVVDVKYHWMFAVFAYFDNSIKRRAKKIVEQNKEGDVLVAHSFGCLAAIYAMQEGAKFSKVFFFAPAAEVDADIPDAFDEMYVIHSTDDSTLTLGEALPFHKFGSMGRVGYKGKNVKVVNVNADGHTHSSYTTPKHLCQWVDFIESKLLPK